MRRKLMGISALTCLAGGWAGLAPAQPRAADPSCEATVGTSCTGSHLMRCTDQYGGNEWLHCSNGIWKYYT